MFDIKFILLLIGLFLFVIGYVNQNKYNCNISPSIDRKIEKSLKNLFYDRNILVDSDRKNISWNINHEQEIYDYSDIGELVSRKEREEASDLGIYHSNQSNSYSAPGASSTR